MIYLLSSHEGVLFAPGERFHGWLMRRHPDGQWVSVRKLETADPDDNPVTKMLMGEADRQIGEAATLLSALEEAQAVRAGADKQRMDWLELRHVTVREPLVYGSRLVFDCHAPTPDEGDEQGPSDLRDRVDAVLTPTGAQP